MDSELELTLCTMKRMQRQKAFAFVYNAHMQMTEHSWGLRIVSRGLSVKLKETEEGRQIKYNPLKELKNLNVISDIFARTLRVH